MRKIIFAAVACIGLAGCNTDGEYATRVCDERDIVSGTCLKSHYVCTAPMELKSDTAARPACYMPGTINSR